MILAKLSTDKTIVFGPVLDSAGAEYTGAAVGDVKISKNNGTPGALNASATLTHKEVGVYELLLKAADLSEVGLLTVTLSKTTYVAAAVPINVLPAKVYDSLIAGTDNLEVDAIQWIGVAPLALSSQQVQAVVPTTQKVDVETIKTKAVTVDAGGTTFPASIHASGAAVAKSPATLATADVTGNLPANVLTWNTAALPTIGTSTLTTGDIDARLLAYDGPTNTEFEARTIAAADYFVVSDYTAPDNTKTGFSLAATGLDAITVTAPTGVATTFPGMVVQVWRRFFKKATKTDTQLITYGDNGTTVVTTQTISDDGTTETQGAAT